MKKLLILIFVVMLLVGCGSSEEPVKQNIAEPAPTSTTAPETAPAPAPAVTEVKEEPKDDVPREYRNALESAQNYIEIMAFSEKGLYNQLTSEYGEQYPAEAAQYAIENIQVDYNQEALESAVNYQQIMPMSDKELFNQLTSEYGEQFTEAQAQYAIDNLPE